MRRILFPLYIHDHLQPRREKRVHLHWRGYHCFVDQFVFLLTLYVCFTVEMRNAGKLQEFVNIESPTLNHKSRRFSLKSRMSVITIGHAQKFSFLLIDFLHLCVNQLIDIDAKDFYYNARKKNDDL